MSAPLTHTDPHPTQDPSRTQDHTSTQDHTPSSNLQKSNSPKGSPEKSSPKKGSWKSLLILPMVGLIRLYQLCISPYTPSACRFTPTCSHYFLEALRKHGLLKGSYLGIRRLLRCHPWGGHGYDPVP